MFVSSTDFCLIVLQVIILLVDVIDIIPTVEILSDSEDVMCSDFPTKKLRCSFSRSLITTKVYQKRLSMIVKFFKSRIQSNKAETKLFFNFKGKKGATVSIIIEVIWVTA